MCRASACGACAALLLAGFLSAKADDRGQSGGGLVGKKVIAIRPDVVLRTGPADDAKGADFTPSCNPLEIAVEQGEWLGSTRTRYWIRRADVVPLAEALGYFTKEIEQSPTAYAYVARSRVRRVGKHDLDQALVDAEAAIRLDPKFARAWMSRGECRKEQKRYPEAIADFTRALELDPQLPSALFMRGYARIEAEDHEGAIADATAGLKRWPHNGWWRGFRACTYINRGIRRCSQGRPNLAEHDFTSAIDDLLSEQRELAAPDAANRQATSPGKTFVDRFLAFTYDYRANSRFQLRKLEAAVSDCAQAIGLRPDYATAYNSRGKALVELGDLEGAMKDYNRALELDPRSMLAHFNRARLYNQMGEVEKAIDDYTAAIASAPDSLLPHYRRGSFYASLGRHREALQDFTRCVALDPTDADSYKSRAEVWCELHEFAEAIEDLTTVIRIEPQNSLAYRQRAEIWQAARNKEDAARDFAEAERLEALQRAEKNELKVR